MFKRISEFFKPKKIEPEKSMISSEEIPNWLDEKEKECLALRTEHISRSREIISKARDDILQLLKDFDAEESELELHPKVEQVNRLNLPQFKKKVESALGSTFSEDDEAYYRQVAEMIDGCFKAYKGPGRYLHHIYGDEIKFFRQLMDSIGKELNNLTEVIKKSRNRLENIETVREALKKYQSASDEGSSILVLLDEIKHKRLDLDSKHESTLQERESVANGRECLEYCKLQSDLLEHEHKIGILVEITDAHARTALPIWRKALRISVDERDRENEKKFDKLLNHAVSQNFLAQSFLSLLNETATLMFKWIEEEKIPLKNSFEKTLFQSQEAYLKEFTDSIKKWSEFVDLCQNERKCLASHPGARELSLVDQKVSENRREYQHLEEEEVKIQGRLHHNKREKDEAAGIIRDTMKELTDGMISVRGIGDETKEDG